MKIAALLTGRGNNTLKDKNILDVLGHPVLYYPAKSAKNCEMIDEYYCSSDCEKILDEAGRLGYHKIVRPAELARPDSQHIDCILHALNIMKEKNYCPDILVVLLANNATVRSDWLADCINKIVNDNTITAVVPVYTDNDHHPLRAKRLTSDGTLDCYIDAKGEKCSTNRQELPKCYFIAHNFWVLNVKTLMEGNTGSPPWTFMGDKVIPYEIGESIDIHEEIDLYIISKWLEENYDD